MSTQIRDILASLLSITNSTVDSTPIGSTTPSTARFITPASGDNSTNAATTAWCLLGFSVLLALPGYIKFPTWLGGVTLQWAQGAQLSDVGSETVAFAVSFANTCLLPIVCTYATGGVSDGTALSYFVVNSWNTAGVNVNFMRNADHTYEPATPLVIAVGY